MRKSKKLRRFLKSAKMGKPWAMYRLGIEYEIGKLLPQDTLKAAEWINRAAELNYAQAIEWINDYSFDDNALTQAY